MPLIYLSDSKLGRFWMKSLNKSEPSPTNVFFVKIRCGLAIATMILSNISNPTMRTGLDFKSAQFDHVRGEAEDWIKMRGLEIQSILVPRALLTRGQRSATRGSGQIHIKLASDWLQRRLLF
jgi:hypothetical protein